MTETRSELWASGYAPRLPNDTAAAIIDCRIAMTECPNCGQMMHYQPWTKGESYRAFSVCHDCGYTEEF